MSNKNNIENFDNFFRESFGNFQPEPPAGVFEAIQSQIGGASAGGVGTGAKVLAKIAKVGMGKIITGAVAVVAAASTVFVVVNNNTQTPQTVKNTTVQNPVSVTENNPYSTNETVTENINLPETGAESTENLQGAAHNTATPHHPTTQSSNASTTNNAGPGMQNDGASAVVNPVQPKNDETQRADNPDADKTPGTKQMIPMYLSGTTVCPNDLVTVTLADDVSKTRYKVNFGDGNIVTSVPGTPITHRYKKPGAYKIVANDVAGTKTTREQIVKVGEIKAGFIVENTEKGTFKFTNTSTSDGAIYTYNWFFGDGEADNTANPTHTYRSFEAGEYTVKLIIVGEAGCVDSFVTVVKQTYTYADQKPIIPNVFSPNGDGINDNFDIGIRNEEKYHLLVFDRSGNTVFESFEKETKWDGTNIQSGEPCGTGTYIMVFVYKIKGFEEQKEKGMIDIKR